MWILAFLLGCVPPTASDDTGTGVDTGDPLDTDTDDTDDTDTEPDPGADEARVRALLDGTSTDSAQQVLQAVAWGAGWPVHTTSDTWLFVAESPVAVAGDFNAWTPEAMTEGAGYWWAEVPASEDAGVRYKFVDGDSWFADPWVRAYEYDDEGLMGFVTPPVDRFHLEHWPALEGRGLVPRSVRVYVPAGTGPWPTLYMADGQNLFDPNAMWGGWRMPDAIAETGTDVLVVGIDNTAHRLEEYAHTDENVSGIGAIDGQGDAYAALVTEDLKPHIEARYPTNGNDGVMGSSMGGLISLYTAHLYPDAYDFVGGLSSSLWFGRYGGDGPMMEELWVGAGVRDIVVYVDSGGDDGGDGCTDPDGDGFPEDDPNDSDGFCGTRQFADALAANGYAWNTTLHHWHEPGAEHNEYFWAQRVARPLEVFTALAP